MSSLNFKNPQKPPEFYNPNINFPPQLAQQQLSQNPYDLTKERNMPTSNYQFQSNGTHQNSAHYSPQIQFAPNGNDQMSNMLVPPLSSVPTLNQQMPVPHPPMPPHQRSNDPSLYSNSQVMSPENQYALNQSLSNFNYSTPPQPGYVNTPGVRQPQFSQNMTDNFPSAVEVCIRFEQYACF